MDDLREVVKTLVDREPLLEPVLLCHYLGGVVRFLVTLWVRAEVVADFLASGQVNEVEVALQGDEAVVAHVARVLHEAQSEERVAATRLVIQLSLRVRSVTLSVLDQLQHLLDAEDGDLGRTLDDELLVSRFVDLQRLLPHLTPQQVVDELIVDLQVADANLELATVGREAVAHASVVRVQLLDPVEEVLHGEYQHSRILVRVVDVALVLDEADAMLLIGTDAILPPLLRGPDFVVDQALLAHHRVGLAGASLPVDEDRPVQAVESRHDDLSDSLLVDVPVAIALAVNHVKRELAMCFLAERVWLPGGPGWLHGGGASRFLDGVFAAQSAIGAVLAVSIADEAGCAGPSRRRLVVVIALVE